MQSVGNKKEQFAAAGFAPQHGGQHASAGEAALEAFRTFAQEKPEVVAIWAFGIGFVLGWKLRIW